MRVHFDVLGWLHMSAGVFSVLTGISLFVLGIGTTMALSDRPSPGTLLPVSAWLLFSASGMFILAGVLTFLIGRALVARRPRGRSAAIALAVPSLIVVPFGTALAVYSFWTLLNDDARREYGNKSMRPPAGTIL